MLVHPRFICYIFAFVNPSIREDLGTDGTYCDSHAGDLDKHLFLNTSNKHVLFSFKNPKISSWFVSLEGA